MMQTFFFMTLFQFFIIQENDPNKVWSTIQVSDSINPAVVKATPAFQQMLKKMTVIVADSLKVNAGEISYCDTITYGGDLMSIQLNKIYPNIRKNKFKRDSIARLSLFLARTFRKFAAPLISSSAATQSQYKIMVEAIAPNIFLLHYSEDYKLSCEAIGYRRYFTFFFEGKNNEEVLAVFSGGIHFD